MKAPSACALLTSTFGCPGTCEIFLPWCGVLDAVECIHIANVPIQGFHGCTPERHAGHCVSHGEDSAKMVRFIVHGGSPTIFDYGRYTLPEVASPCRDNHPQRLPDLNKSPVQQDSDCP